MPWSILVGYSSFLVFLIIFGCHTLNSYLQISQCALREHKIEVDFLFIAKKNQLNCTKQDSMYQERNLKVETSTMLTHLYIYIYKRIPQNKVRQWYLLIHREDISLTLSEEGDLFTK